jgi:serine phosphatase RsbU (regulator of sigma subunit)/anti-sigma regulatory factor (Ser/Thr protein kinase)
VLIVVIVAYAWREAASRGAALVELARTNLELANRLAERTIERDDVARDEALAQLLRTNIQEAYLQGEFDREHRASSAFQEAALPSRLPVVPGMHFRAVYRAAKTEAHVGGDWYDAFRLDDGRIVITIGDVMGKGLVAAVMMGAVRQSLRGAAQILAEPIAILNAADRALRSEDPAAIVTAFVGILDPVSLMLTYASAGHPPPFVRLANGDIVGLGGSGLPLGLRSIQNYPPEDPRTIYVDHSALLVFYTDGLIEATRDIAQGEERVHDALLHNDVWHAANSAAAIADHVLEEVVDDVAILTIRIDSALISVSRPIPGDRDARWRFDVADSDAAKAARRDMVTVLRRYRASEKDTATAELVFSELLGNVVQHGGGGEVEFALDLSGDRIVLNALDTGPGFTYMPRLPVNGDMGESGRGLFIVRSSTHELTFTRRVGGGSHARAVLPFVLRGHARRATATIPTGSSFVRPAVSSAASAVALSASSSPASSTMRAPASNHRSGSARPTSP